MANRRELVVAIVSDASQFSRGFDKAKKDVDGFARGVDKASKDGLGKMDSRVGAVTSSLKGFAAAAGVAFGAQQIVQFARSTITEFSNLNESINAVRVTFGAAATDVLRLGENAAESVGLSNAEFNTLAVGFSAFADQIAGDTGDVSDVIDDLTGRIADFASVMNLEVNDAAEKFRSGLAGETEPLRKFGIDVSAAKVEVKALELGLGDAHGKLSEGDKILARYNLIMEQTEKSAGDFANTSDDLANKQRILSAQWKDAQADIGGALAPLLSSLLDITQDLLPLVTVLAKGIADAIIRVFGPLADLVGLLSKVMTESGESSAKAALEFEFTARQMELLRGEADEIPSRLTALAAGMDVVSEKARQMRLKDVRTGFKDTGDAAREAADKLKIYSQALDNLVNPIARGVNALSGYAAAIEAQDEAIKEFGADSSEAAQAGVDVLSAYSELISAAQGVADLTGTNVETALSDLGEKAGVPAAVIQTIIDLLAELDGTTVSAGIDFSITRPAPPRADDPVGGAIADRTRLPEGFASGGLVAGGVPIMVGERGREMFVPESAGRIIPNHQLTSNQTYAPSVVVQGNVDQSTLGDIQRELILAGVGRWAEVD